MTLAETPYKITGPAMGSEPTAAGGGRKEASEWPRSADVKERRRRRQMPGTATGEYFGADA